MLSVMNIPAIFVDRVGIKRVGTLRIGSTSRKKDFDSTHAAESAPAKKKKNVFFKGCPTLVLPLHFSVDLDGRLPYQRFKRGAVCLENSCSCTSEKLRVI